MPRSKRIKREQSPPDLLYNSRLVTRLINQVMKEGKKSLAQKLVYQALEQIKKKGKEPVDILEKAVQNVRPMMEVRPRRVGGASYQVPMKVKGNRRVSLAVRWLILEARKRPNSQYHTFDQKLSAELLAASQGEGGAVKRKEISHKMAEANKAFAHFRW